MSGGDGLVEVIIGEPTETLLHTVSRDLDGDDDPVHAPAALVEAFEAAVTTAYSVGDALVAYAEARRTRGEHGPLPAGVVQVRFGDPRYCWNVVRHLPHDFRYQVVDRTGVYYCDGTAEMAAAALGVAIP